MSRNPPSLQYAFVCWTLTSAVPAVDSYAGPRFRDFRKRWCQVSLSQHQCSNYSSIAPVLPFDFACGWIRELEPT
ncbi:hypothetical protein BKA93DRAFT_199191 [Sparassis latifolia]